MSCSNLGCGNDVSGIGSVAGRREPAGRWGSATMQDLWAAPHMGPVRLTGLPAPNPGGVSMGDCSRPATASNCRGRTGLAVVGIGGNSGSARPGIVGSICPVQLTGAAGASSIMTEMLWSLAGARCHIVGVMMSPGGLFGTPRDSTTPRASMSLMRPDIINHSIWS